MAARILLEFTAKGALGKGKFYSRELRSARDLRAIEKQPQILRSPRGPQNDTPIWQLRLIQTLMAHWGGRQLLGAVHQEGEGDEDSGYGDHDPDDVDVGEEAGLDLGHAVDLSTGVLHSVGSGRAELAPCPSESGAHLVVGRIAGGCELDQHCKVLLALTGEESGDEANPDAAAEIAHEGGEPADLVVLFLRDAGVTERVDGDEEEGKSEGDEDAPAYSLHEADVLIQRGHAPKAPGGDDEADGDEFAGVEPGRECSGDREKEHEDDSARGNCHAGLAGGVAHDLLQELRDEDGRRVERDTDHEHDELRHADVAAGEEAEIEDGVIDGEFAPEEEGESDDSSNEEGDDEARAEPVVFLPLVEHDLEGSYGDDEEAESPIVDAFSALADFSEIRRVFDEAIGEDEREDSDGDVEEEDPAPGIVVDDPAADGGAENRRGDDGDSVDGESHGALLRREGVGEDGLLAGLEASTGCTLEDAEEDEHRQAEGKAAEQGGEGEEEDAGHVEALATDAIGDPAGDGQDHGIGDEVAGEDPGGFLETGPQGAADVRHGDVGNGGIERLHEGGQSYGDCDSPGVGAGAPCLVKCSCRSGGHAVVRLRGC
jgi:hypothetical protein